MQNQPDTFYTAARAWIRAKQATKAALESWDGCRALCRVAPRNRRLHGSVRLRNARAIHTLCNRAEVQAFKTLNAIRATLRK